MLGDIVLSAERLNRTYGQGARQVDALVDVTLEVRAGELVVLRGPSGSGKTTLLNILGGLDEPTSGTVWLGERAVTGASESVKTDMRRHEIGFIFQNFALLSALTAAENIELPMRISGVPADQRGPRVAELLDVVGLADHAAQRPLELSGGQQQRLGIARAIANDPRLIIADEPTGQLDQETGASIMRLLLDVVRAEGTTALISTHDATLQGLADASIRLTDGRVDPAGA